MLRRGQPPREALAALDPGERVLAWATLASGEALLATPRGLRMPDPALLPWHLVDKVTWRDGVLTVVSAEELSDPDLDAAVLREGPARAFDLATPRRLPHVVRVRVENSIAHSWYHHLRPVGGLRVIGRRVSGRDGLRWQLLFDRGTDRGDPAVRTQAVGLLAQARAAARGIEPS